MFCGSHFLKICISFIVIWQPTVSQPDSPTSLKWEEIYSTSIVVSWVHVPGLRYKVRGEVNPSTFTSCDVGEDVGEISTFEIRTISDGTTRLIANTLYDIGVCAVDDNGISVAMVIKKLGTGPEPPTITSAFLDARNQIVVAWTAPCGVAAETCDDSNDKPEQYIIAYSSSSGDKNKTVKRSSPDTLPVTTVTLDDVTSNTEYQITVMTMTSFIPVNLQLRKVYSDPSDERIVVTIPSKVAKPTVETVSSTVVSINWKKVEGTADEIYTVSWEPNQGPNQGSKNATGISTQIDNLISNTLYNFKVTAVNAGGSGEESEADSAITLVKKIDAPSASTSSDTAIDISWSEADDGGGYHTIGEYLVEWTPADGVNGGSKVVKSGTTTTITGLSSNQLYSVTIGASAKGNLVGVESNPVEATTLPSKVATPTAQTVSSTLVSISWTRVVGTADEFYTVSWEPNHGPNQGSKDVTGTSTQIDNLISNTLYNFKVTAVNDGGSGKESEADSAATLVKQIDAPSASTSSDTAIDISWSEADDGGGYHTIGEYLVEWTPADGVNGGSKVVKSGTTTTITGLSSNQLYSVTIGASANGNLVGVESNPVEATTLPSKVSKPTAQTVSSTLVSISWTKVEGTADEFYTVSWEPNQGPNQRSENATGTSTQIDNLISNTLYNFKVTAVNAGGSGEESETDSAITLVNEIDAPSATTSSDTAIDISWSEADVGGGHHTIGEYLVEWTPADGVNGGSEVVKSGTTTTITGLSSNQLYSVTIGASANGNLVGVESNPVEATTLVKKIDVLSASTSSDTAIDINWSQADDGGGHHTIGEYLVKWTPPDGVDGGSKFVNGDISTTITGLSSNQLYSITVGASATQSLVGVESNPVEATTLPAKANQPTSKSATDSAITLQWDEKKEGSVDRTYMVFWRIPPNSVMFNETATFNNQTTIKNLNGSTRYAFSLRSENEAGPALELSDEADFLTTPGKPQSPNSCEGTNPTTTAVVNWSKPDGGDEIEGYTLEWTATSGNLSPDFIPHEKENNSYTQAKPGLLPGEIYTVNITANNSGGSSSVALQHRAHPDTMSELEAKKNEEDPSNYLDITWVKPYGTGDNIKVEYTNQSDNSLKTAETNNFDTTFLSISVLPGNTYDITAYAISGNLNSTKQPLRMNSKPAAVNITKKEVTKNSIKLTWEFEGFAESVKIEVVNNSHLDAEINDTTQNEYTIMDLPPGTKYKVDLYTIITNVTNQKEPSEVTSDELQTMEEIPPDVGLIVGLTVTGILLLVLIILGVLYYRRRKNGSKKPSVPAKSTTNQSLNNNGPYPPKERREVRLTDFKNHVESMHANSDMQFSAEYRQFSDVVINPSVNASSQEENKLKNRYKNVLAYDATRVVLSNVSDAAEDYINANFIDGYRHDREYIAAQGPLPNTKDDFWKMVWEQDCKIIVMVTQTVEGGRVKCDHYWPYDNKTIAVADMTLKLLDEVDSGEWIVRKLELHKEYETRVISHFHYTAWPDHGVPKTTKSLVQFVQLVRNHIEKDGLNNGPPVVHCSAGVGRTGTFIAIDHLLQHLKEHPNVDIFGIVYEMRKQRNLMVQTEGQYIFLHHVVEDYLDKKFDEDQEPLYENAGFVKDPIYENTDFVGKPLDGSS